MTEIPKEPPALTGLSLEQTVNPWNVSGEVGEDGVTKAIDYNKLTDEFGTKRIDDPKDNLLARFEQVTGHRPHRFMRRNIFFSHRDLDLILDRYERGEPFFLYTGRGPSSDSMHLGHTIPFEFTKWLQDVFDVPLVIMMTDDEKYIFGEFKKSKKEIKAWTKKNIMDIIAFGFDMKKTFIFTDWGYMGGSFYENVTSFSMCYSVNTANAVFGFDKSASAGRIHFAAVQGATAFATSFPHIFGDDEDKTAQIPALIPCAIDQDPYFRLTRDVAQRLHLAKPSLIHARFLDALQGPGSKMSASVETSAVFLIDDMKRIKTKINKHAFSGGQNTAEEQREKGGDPEVDVSYQWLRFFLEDDDDLERTRVAYRKGEMLTGELKAKCIEEVQKYVKAYQERRVKVNEEVVEQFMSKRPLEYGGNPNPKKIEPTKGDESGAAAKDGDQKMSKNELKKLEKQKKIAEKKAAHPDN